MSRPGQGVRVPEEAQKPAVPEPQSATPDAAPQKKHKKKRGAGIACIVVGALVFVYQAAVLVMYGRDLFASYDLYAASGILTDGIINLVSYALVLVAAALLVWAGVRSVRGLPAKRWTFASAGFSSVCMLWAFNLLVFFVVGVMEMGASLFSQWPTILYGAVVILLCVFTWVMSAMVDKVPGEERRRPLF